MKSDVDTQTTREMIRAEDVHKRFGHLEVLKGINLTVEPGQTVVVIGPSGSGKSTFLRCLNHLETIERGRIYLDGELMGYREVNGRLKPASPRAVACMRAECGMVFQRFNLFPHMTALGNVAEAPIHVRGVSKREATAQAQALLVKVGLADKAHNYPSQLSGGPAAARSYRPRAGDGT